MQFIDLTRQYARIEKDVGARMAAIMKRGAFIMGAEVTELELQLAAFTGAGHCVACSSGTDALLLALMAQGVGPGDAVFTTPFTFFATAEAIALTGATPVFVDIDPETLMLDPSALALAIADLRSGRLPSIGTPPALRPRGIIPVDMYGTPADYQSINKIALENGLFVLEDACQSFGGSYRGAKCCALASMAATSFFPTKPLGCYGDGGAVFTDDAELAGKFRSLRIHGMGTNQYDNVAIGINGRMDTLQAAVLLAKIDLIEEELKMRNKIADRYASALSGKVGLPKIPTECIPSQAYYTILIPERDKIKAKLAADGIPTMIYYPVPLHLQPAFKSLDYKTGSMPHAEQVVDQVLSLPMYPYLTEQEQDTVIEKLRAVL